MDKKIVGIFICTLMLTAAGITVAETSNVNKADFLEEKIEDESYRVNGKSRTPIELDLDLNSIVPSYGNTNLGAPLYEFEKSPTVIMESYYDYSPGSYITHPIRMQSDNGDGHYLTFFGRPTKNAERRQYYAYYDSSYNQVDMDTITTYDTWQGYGGIDIHPATGNCVAAWHEDLDGDGTYEAAMSYDNYAAGNTPGNWQGVETVPQPAFNEYIWPYIRIGPSPEGQGYVRIYQLTTNAENTAGGLPCEDVRLMYIDVENTNSVDMSNILDKANWETTTIFSDWRAKSCRPFQAFAIDYNNPGKVAFIGDAAWLEGDLGDMPVDEGVFVWESLDYGTTWDEANLHSDGPGNPLYYVDNPGLFEDVPVEDYPQLEVSITGWHGTAIYDGEGDLHWTMMQTYGFSDAEGSYIFPDLSPQAEVVWDGSSFSFHEVSPMPGTDPSGHSVPWDSENIYPVYGWSSYGAGVFHENTQKNAVNTDNDWIAQMWVDSTYHKFGIEAIPNYEEYKFHPMIYIAISNDNGESWFEPIKLTDIFSEKFDFSEQITVYPYMCDKIIDLGDNWGLILMYYFDDNQFGSAVQGGGFDPSGDIVYCAIKVRFADNEAPSIPTIDGDSNGKPGREYDFTFSSTDPEGNDVYYWVDWGDGNNSGWDGPHASGAEATISYTWEAEDNFTIMAKAKDVAGAESDWATFEFSTPKNKAVTFNLFERFPLIQKILQLPIFQKIFNI